MVGETRLPLARRLSGGAPYPLPTLCAGTVSNGQPPQRLRGRAPGPGVGRPSNFRARRVADSDLDLMQGTLDLLVLKALIFGPRHGYAVARWVRETTDEELRIEEGALYTALHRLEKRGWIEAEWGLSDANRRAKYYQLTASGRRQLRAETALWTRYAQAVFKVLRTA